MTHPLFSYHAVKHLAKPRLGKAEALFCQENLSILIDVWKKTHWCPWKITEVALTLRYQYCYGGFA